MLGGTYFTKRARFVLMAVDAKSRYAPKNQWVVHPELKFFLKAARFELLCVHYQWWTFIGFNRLKSPTLAYERF